MRKLIFLTALLLLATSAGAADIFAKKFPDNNDAVTYPGTYVSAISPHDTNELTQPCRAVYVGGAGNLKITGLDGGTATFVGVPAGSLLPVRPKVVFSTNTTATSLVCVY